MTNKTVLSDEEIRKIADAFFTKDDDQDEGLCFARDVEQAVLQSPEIQQAIDDSKRVDWLADPSNSGNVMLPREIVLQNPHSLRDAIDAAMELKP